MEENQKCSNKLHKEVISISFCEQCKMFMCNKCLIHHKELFENHPLIDIDKNDKDLFIDFCKEIGHGRKYEFFCKNHNELCCVCCISKLKLKGYGQNKDCDICSIEEIKEEKKNKLIENIKYLQELKNNLKKILEN